MSTQAWVFVMNDTTGEFLDGYLIASGAYPSSVSAKIVGAARCRKDEASLSPQTRAEHILRRLHDRLGQTDNDSGKPIGFTVMRRSPGKISRIVKRYGWSPEFIYTVRIQPNDPHAAIRSFSNPYSSEDSKRITAFEKTLAWTHAKKPRPRHTKRSKPEGSPAQSGGFSGCAGHDGGHYSDDH